MSSEIQNLDWKNLLPAIYQDLAQPSARKIGLALSSVIGIIFTPIGKASQILELNLVVLTSKLEKIEESSAVPVLPEIGVPILERLKYTRSEELVNLYTELFIKASNRETQGDAHPSYFEIITNLCGDEAKILEEVFSRGVSFIAYIKIISKKREGDGDYTFVKYLTDYSRSVDFHTKEREPIYWDNLLRLGIIEDMGDRKLADENEYADLLSDERIKDAEKIINDSNRDQTVQEGYLLLTDFGKNFINTCISKV